MARLLEWDTLPTEDKVRYSHLFHCQQVAVEPVKFKVFCTKCNVTLFEDILGTEWGTYLTPTEQEHLDTDGHKQAVLMWKLAGEENGD